MIPFPLNENQFSFVADHLLVGQLCTNPKSDKNLLSCRKVTQCSTSEIGDAPLNNGRAQGDENKVYGFWCGFKWGPYHATSHLRSRLESQLQSWMCWIVWWSPGAIRWPVVDPGCCCMTWCRPTSPKRPRLGFRRSATTLYPSLTEPLLPWPEPTSFGHTSRTSPTCPSTTPKAAWSPQSAEYSPRSCRCLWKRHAPSSGSVSRRWLRLKAATLNRCQLYYITKLAELIFSIKVIKIKL